MNRLARLRRNQAQVRRANGERQGAAPGGAIPPWKELSKLDADEAAALAASLGVEVPAGADHMKVKSLIHASR